MGSHRVRDDWNDLAAAAAEEGEKKHEKIFEETIVKNFPNLRKEITIQIQEAQSPIQDKPKEKYTKTHINQANEN